MLTPQGEAKGLDTIGKRAKYKANSGDTKSAQSMNASSPWTNACKLTQVLPLNWVSIFFSPLMQRLSVQSAFIPQTCTLLPYYELKTQFSPLLVMHESRLKWAWASQIDNEHNNMLEMKHRAYKKAQISLQASPTWEQRHIHMWHG
jgi:hypothetical protein